MIIMKIKIVSDDGLMINVDGNGDIVGLRIIAGWGVSQGGST